MQPAVLRPIEDAATDIRRGLTVRLHSASFRDYKWSPHLGIVVSVEWVGLFSVQIVGLDLFVYYNESEIGPLAPLPGPKILRPPSDGILVRLRKDLYPDLVTELRRQDRGPAYVWVRGMLTLDAPAFDGLLEYPLDMRGELK